MNFSLCLVSDLDNVLYSGKPWFCDFVVVRLSVGVYPRCFARLPPPTVSVPGKMLESIVADDMMSHLEHNKLILDSQHGFRSSRSCLTNLVDFFHDMFSIYDRSRAVGILYLDFRKAFDKVPHKRLMAKVRSLGIIDEVGDWIEDWLSDRKQRVVINGTSSGWREVTSGVP